MENNKEKTVKKEEVKVAVPVNSEHAHKDHVATHDPRKTTAHETHKDEKKDHIHTENKKTEQTHAHEQTGGHTHSNEQKDKKEGLKVAPKITRPTVKKDVALVRAPSVHMGKRHGMYICSFIKGKSIDNAIADLEQVILLKKAVPFKGEIPHRKGKGMMSGRYPVAASKLFIPMLKNLKGSVIFNGMNLDKTRISTAYAQWTSRPQRRGGMKGKRSYITIEAKELKK